MQHRLAQWWVVTASIATGCFDPNAGQLESTGSSTGTPPLTSGTGQDSGSTSTPGDSSSSGSTTPDPDGSSTGSTGSIGSTGPDASSSSTDPTSGSSSTGPMGVCGDGMIDPGEDCDDANEDPNDDCVDCAAASCGDGFLWIGNEACDDGNATDLDACTNACTFGSILVSGNANSFLTPALTTLGEAFASEALDWPTPLSAGVLVLGRDGGLDMPPDYQAHLDAGAHLLVAGGSSTIAFGDWINLFFSSTGSVGWHQSSACISDWNTTGMHPITAYLPATYEFSNQSTSYHMVHFTAAGQPPETELLGQSCEMGPDNFLLATRRFPSGGTFTYLATDIGRYDGPGTQADFVVPFFQGYLEYIRMPAP